ncbi:MAG: AraC family transcriptional regulator [Ferruginibacter sp.]|nr:AraC family transcriptional regulator [Ferruginibacter sp.]
MALQWNIVLLMVGGLQALMLAALLSRRENIRAGAGFLTLYLLAMIVQIVFKVADKYWLMQHLKTGYLLSYQVPLLYGPLIYLFTRNVFKQRNGFSPPDWIHFLPFVFITLIINFLPHYSDLVWLYKPFKGITGLCLQVASLTFYHYRAFRLWQENSKAMPEQYSATQIARTKWLKKFVLLSFPITLVTAGLIFFMYQAYPAYTFLRFGFILLTAFIYWISHEAIRQPQLFTFIVGGNDHHGKLIHTPGIPASFVHAVKEKYANSKLKEEDSARILNQLHALMVQKKIYTDPAINIDKLAALLNTSRHTLSQVINEKLGQSFYDYINSWRIDEAKQLLKEPGRQNHKIAFIAYDAGFNSLSTFNEVFKKITGLTPSQYKAFEVNDCNKQRV